jgi:glycine cleavage system H protein
MLPTDCLFTQTHEYLRVQDGSAAVGITTHATEQLGDVVFVELPAVGRVLKKGESFGVVESVKAVSDLYAPVGGTVAAVNEELNDQPGLVNEDSFGKGWIIRLEPFDQDDLASCLNSEAYAALIGG